MILSETLTSLLRPNGVNLGKTDPVWLTDGDVVEVGLDNVGTCTNEIKHV
jgi:2-keto-4-pentenoate hydratase/2-oxohepta-3-ene-1,7-dioic acid hydratase in catechol pathway